MNAPYLILGLLCGLAIGHALNWATRTPRSRTDRHEARDCEGTSPCSTCQDKRECGRSGCVRAALGAGGLGDGAERRVEAAIEKLQRCSLGCWPFGQCKAAMHGTPSECAAGVVVDRHQTFSQDTPMGDGKALP